MDREWYEESTVDTFDTQDSNVNEDSSYKNNILRVEERIDALYFDIRDYLHETGESELLMYLDMDDVALLLYKKSYLEFVKDEATMQ